MSIAFENVTHPPLTNFTAAAPDGALVVIVGESAAGKSELLRLAAGLDRPASGQVIGPGSRRLLRAGDGRWNGFAAPVRPFC